MKNWLSQTWEPDWRSFRYFNIYRLIVAAVLLLSFLMPLGWSGMHRLPVGNLLQIEGLLGAYLLLVGGGAAVSAYWPHRFNLQLTAHVLLDVATVTLLMYPLGGVASGIGIVLMVSLAAASLVAQGRLVLFYAAMATLAVLAMQFLGILHERFDSQTVVQAGLLSAGYFATAILARLLGQRAMMQEELARRRGVALENQMRIGGRIIERMQGGVLVVGRNGAMLRHNPGAAQLLSTPESDGAPLAAFVPSLALAFARWQRGELSGDFDFVGPTGKPLRARFESTDSSDGEALVFVEDIGRVRTQARELKLASLGRLTASIAHEVRNPLAAISHASDLLHEERRGEMQERLLRILHDNVFRLDRIVQDILQLGRSEGGQPEEIALKPFLRDFVEEFKAVKRLAEDAVEIDCEGATFWFDRSQLLQVMWNLAGNAARHSTQKAGCVRLSVVTGDDGRVELHVMDDGAGVPDEVREQIFEPFFTTRHHGTGLGLFIARELCEGNSASLELVPDSGGHFVIVGRSACQIATNKGGLAAN